MSKCDYTGHYISAARKKERKDVYQIPGTIVPSYDILKIARKSTAGLLRKKVTSGHGQKLHLI